jgi:hypothetical protein
MSKITRKEIEYYGVDEYQPRIIGYKLWAFVFVVLKLRV